MNLFMTCEYYPFLSARVIKAIAIPANTKLIKSSSPLHLSPPAICSIASSAK